MPQIELGLFALQAESYEADGAVLLAVGTQSTAANVSTDEGIISHANGVGMGGFRILPVTAGRLQHAIAALMVQEETRGKCDLEAAKQQVSWNKGDGRWRDIGTPQHNLSRSTLIDRQAQAGTHRQASLFPTQLHSSSTSRQQHHRTTTRFGPSSSFFVPPTKSYFFPIQGPKSIMVPPLQSTPTAATTIRHQTHHLSATGASARGLKYMVVGLVVGLVVGMQIMLVQVNSRDQPGAAGGPPESAASTALFGDDSEPRLEQQAHEPAAAVASSSSPSLPPADFPKALPAGAMETDVSENDDCDGFWAPRGAFRLLTDRSIDYLPHTQQVRTPDSPWPRPLSAADVEHWLDVLGKYTEGGPSSKAKPPKDMYVKAF